MLVDDETCQDILGYFPDVLTTEIDYALARKVKCVMEPFRQPGTLANNKRWQIEFKVLKRLDEIKHHTATQPCLPRVCLEAYFDNKDSFELKDWTWKEKSTFLPMIETVPWSIHPKPISHKKIQLTHEKKARLEALIRLDKTVKTKKPPYDPEMYGDLLVKSTHPSPFIPQHNLDQFKALQWSLRQSDQRHARQCELEWARFKF
ncbi:hypothetical protein CU098_005556 [Rhizopus stolonifer]|uniref:Uncharacterized protein n=1 Tax=Rhizopus stolonifer TaxID=4846 RepID=A0A367K8P8_RHIST|nr:hypothetical protein CU098_005556 [Rhizopus stolonifer]